MEDSNGRPADIGIENGHGFGPNVTACYDVVGCATNANSYVEKAGRYKDGGMAFSTSRKLSNAIKLRVAAKDLVIIPMAFDTQGGLHSNWRKTFEGWAERWASQGEGRTKALQGAVVRSWVAMASMEIQRAQFFLTEQVRKSVEDHVHGGIPHAWRPLGAEDFGSELVACPPLER